MLYRRVYTRSTEWCICLGDPTGASHYKCIWECSPDFTHWLNNNNKNIHIIRSNHNFSLKTIRIQTTNVVGWGEKTAKWWKISEEALKIESPPSRKKNCIGLQASSAPNIHFLYCGNNSISVEQICQSANNWEPTQPTQLWKWKEGKIIMKWLLGHIFFPQSYRKYILKITQPSQYRCT